MQSFGQVAARAAGRLLGRLTRDARGLFAGRSTPSRLRAAMVVTVAVAVLFGVLGAIGVGRRDSSLQDANAAAAQLIEVQNVQVALVQADALATENYLRGGSEDATQREQYVAQMARVSSGLVAVSNRVLPNEAAKLAAVSAQLAEYSGLIEQARANNRQGFPIGAAYLRTANNAAGEMVAALVEVQASLRHQVNDNLDRGDRAGVWLQLTGWLLLILLVGGAAGIAIRFRRFVNMPLAIAGVVVLLVLLIGGSVQGSSMTDAEQATAGPLQAADLASQARSAAFNARTLELVTLINRGNSAPDQAEWSASADIAQVAIDRLCAANDECGLDLSFAAYTASYSEMRTTDDAGNWNDARDDSLGGESSAAFAAFALDSEAVAVGYTETASVALGGAPNGLGGLRVVVFLAGLAVAVLTLAGYGQRLREYR